MTNEVANNEAIEAWLMATTTGEVYEKGWNTIYPDWEILRPDVSQEGARETKEKYLQTARNAGIRTVVVMMPVLLTLGD